MTETPRDPADPTDPADPMTERARLDALPTPLLARAATAYAGLGGTANVVMQLARPGVGYGVKDSRVEGARLFDDPERRSRTTLGYLAVAVLGTAPERAAYRRAVNGSHAGVRSAPGEQPAYRATDPDLQRWVGACLYTMFEGAYEAVHGPLGADAERFYAEGVILGGMLQMPASLWPADRGAFEDYWREGLAQAHIDDPVRDYLWSVLRLDYLAKPAPRHVVERRRLLTTGHLPEVLREQMGLTWSHADADRFERFTSRTAAVCRRLPPRLQGYPFTAAIKDVRRRLAAGKPLLEG